MHPKINSLTDRQKDILRLLVRGHDAKSAANVLNVSVNSINEGLREARRKLGTTSSREAARFLCEAEGGRPQEIWNEKFGLDGPPAHLATDIYPAARRVKQVSLFIILGVGIMLLVVLVLSLSSGSADNSVGPSNSLPPSSTAPGSSGVVSVKQGLRPTYLVALDGTLQGQSLAREKMTVLAGGVASVASSGLYDMHFSVTPDLEHQGKLLISVNVVIPRKRATSRYSRTLSVIPGEVANFALEEMGNFPSPGAIAITALQVQPQT